MKKGDELEVKLEGFAFEGKSVARVDGLVLMVEGAVPGDRVRVRIRKTKSSYAEAIAIQILVPSPLRVEPRCGYFGVCGGCRWQQVGYEAQLVFKRQHVVDALERIGGFRGVEVRPTLGSDDAYYYRNKMEFSFGESWRMKEELAALPPGEAAAEADRFALGLHIPGRYDRVLDLHACFLQSESSVSIVNTVRAFCKERRLPIYSTVTHEGYLRNLVIRESKRTGDVMVNLVTKDDRPAEMEALCRTLLGSMPYITTIVNNITSRLSQVAIGESEKTYHGPGYISEVLGRRTYRISANSFFQTNTLQAERLYDTVKHMAGLVPDESVFDLYSGTGTIALHLAGEAARIIGIESVASAVADAEKNARLNAVSNCTFLLGDIKNSLERGVSLLPAPGGPAVVIADPPRAGMHERVVLKIRELKPRKVIYVSCNPATQARDLRILTGEGGYILEAVQPVDMFPQTYHIENVASLVRVDP